MFGAAMSCALAILMTGGVRAQDPAETSILRSLPANVQKEIEDVRDACSEQLISEGEPDWVIHPDDGLSRFTVSGRQAIMINYGNVCGESKGWKGITYTNRGSSTLDIYVASSVRSKTIWKKAFSTDATAVFLSTIYYTVNTDGTVKFNDGSAVFKALVVRVFLGSEECPIPDPQGSTRQGKILESGVRYRREVERDQVHL
jgi:hypothetical protein